MSKLIELQAITRHIASWAKMPYDKTTKAVIMSLITKRDNIIRRG